MRIFVKAQPNSREAKIEKIGDSQFVVAVREMPVQGQANEAIIKAFSEYFGVSKMQVKIISGWTSRIKAIEITES